MAKKKGKPRKPRKRLRSENLAANILGLFERVPREFALKRQLDAAISLWFRKRDALAIHLIAMAAYSCLCHITGKKIAVSTDVYDWLRHASSDRLDRIDFSESDNTKALCNATMLFFEVFDWRSARMRAFDLYYLLNPPGLLARHVDPNVKAFMPKTLSVQDVSDLRRMEFFRKLTARFLAENPDKAPVAEETISEPRLAPDFS